MQNDGLIALLLLLLLFIVQPVLLGIAAGKAYKRSGTLWGFLAFGINAGILAFFESQFSSRSMIEKTYEVSTIAILSSMLICTTLKLIHNDPQSTINRDVFRRGVFRVWSCVSAVWIILCAFEFTTIPFTTRPWNCYQVSCDIFVRSFLNVVSHGVHPSYFDLGKAFIGVPALAFLVALAVCWVADGFRRTRPTEVGPEPTRRLERYGRLNFVNGAADNAKRVTNPILADPASAKAYLDREYAEFQISERFDWIYKYDATSVEV